MLMSNRERFRDIKVALDREVNLERVRARMNYRYDKPDPLMVASKYRDEYISLICALVLLRERPLQS